MGPVPEPLTADELFACLAAAERAFDGETVDLLAHGLQCEALLSENGPDDLELQVAGLLNDVGTVVEPPRPDRCRHRPRPPG